MSETQQLPLLEKEDLAKINLWVVRIEDTVYAHEKCATALSLTGLKIKRTNLTGGQEAFCGGEAIFFEEHTVIINGCSGRYGPRSAEEMLDVAIAFKASGYNVASMGYDTDTGTPLPFLGVFPQLIGEQI